MTLFNVPLYLDWPVQFCVFATLATWLASLVTSNVSQVDRLWTFLPTIYTAYYALLPLWPNEQTFWLVPYTPKAFGWSFVKDFSPRALFMLGLITIWMFRLSYNTYRRGLFNLKDEDYRWAVLRTQIPPWLFQITNLTFIAATQNVLLLLLGLPTYTAALQPHTPLGPSDYALGALTLVVLALEFTSDNQQFAFHAYKHAYLARGKKDASVKPYNTSEQWPGARLSWTPADAERGFLTRGLWAYSRHPNFACEQSFWWIITLFPLLAAAPPNFPHSSEIPTFSSILVALSTPFLWPLLFASLRTTFGPLLLNLLPAIALSALFFSSTAYTEAITASKYPLYQVYRRRVAMFQPTGTLIWKRVWILLLGGGKNELREVEAKVWGNDVKTLKKD